VETVDVVAVSGAVRCITIKLKSVFVNDMIDLVNEGLSYASKFRRRSAKSRRRSSLPETPPPTSPEPRFVGDEDLRFASLRRAEDSASLRETRVGDPPPFASASPTPHARNSSPSLVPHSPPPYTARRSSDISSSDASSEDFEPEIKTKSEEEIERELTRWLRIIPRDTLFSVKNCAFCAEAATDDGATVELVIAFPLVTAHSTTKTELKRRGGVRVPIAPDLALARMTPPPLPDRARLFLSLSCRGEVKGISVHLRSDAAKYGGYLLSGVDATFSVEAASDRLASLNLISIFWKMIGVRWLLE
jgi:hypothetical protein